MSVTYNITTNFAAKDTLPADDPNKVVNGTDFSVEYLAIQSAFTECAPINNASFTGITSASSFVGPLTGNADTATALASPVTITFDGDVSGTAVFDGSGPVTSTISVNGANDYDHSEVISGAEVFSAINVTDGVVNQVSKRVMTLADLGYTGDPDGNAYTHPEYIATDINTSGALVVDQIQTNSTGHVTNMTTRTLTAANLGALKDTTDTFTGTLSVNGSVVATGNVTAYSDMALKENIVAIDSPMDKVMAIGGYDYDRTDIDMRQSGVLAQELQAIMPSAVTEHEGNLAVNYNAVIALLVEAVKELGAK